MKRYCEIFKKVIKFNAIAQLNYKLNFILSIPITLSWTVAEIITNLLIFYYTNDICGWGRYEMLFLLGTYFVIDGIFSTFLLPNITDLSLKIQKGELDHVLLKPLDSQFLVFTYRINFNNLYAVLEGILLIIYSLIQQKEMVKIDVLIIYILFVILGVLFYALIMFSACSFAFSTTKLDFIRSLFLVVADYSRKPIEIFPDFIKAITIFIVPIAFISYVPVAIYFRKIEYGWYWLGIPLVMIWIFISRSLWKKMIRLYTSASS